MCGADNESVPREHAKPHPALQFEGDTEVSVYLIIHWRTLDTLKQFSKFSHFLNLQVTAHESTQSLSLFFNWFVPTAHETCLTDTFQVSEGYIAILCLKQTKTQPWGCNYWFSCPVGLCLRDFQPWTCTVSSVFYNGGNSHLTQSQAPATKQNSALKASEEGVPRPQNEHLGSKWSSRSRWSHLASGAKRTSVATTQLKRWSDCLGALGQRFRSLVTLLWLLAGDFFPPSFWQSRVV